jgi:hypothetical protein
VAHEGGAAGHHSRALSDYRDACNDDLVIEFEFETYGEPRVHLLLRWDVAAPLGEMFERLRSLSLRNGEEEAIEDETAPDGQSRLIISWYDRFRLPKPRLGKARLLICLCRQWSARRSCRHARPRRTPNWRDQGAAWLGTDAPRDPSQPPGPNTLSPFRDAGQRGTMTQKLRGVRPEQQSFGSRT